MLKRLLLGASLAALSQSAALADDNALNTAGTQIGARYWYSVGRNAYNYYGDTTASVLVSRLTYGNLAGSSAELNGRGDTSFGAFFKGTLGGGAFSKGSLIDEDFPPAIVPYSQTRSNADGSFSFGNLDVGYSFIRQHDVRLGAFVGYGRWNEDIMASGCVQTGGNPNVCVPSLPSNWQGINETDKFDMLRLGLTADVNLTSRLRLSGDVAYVRTAQRARDVHNYTFGEDAAKGNGSGLQAEAVASYRLTDIFDIGIGGRYWRLNTTAVDAYDQRLDYNVSRYGLFLQAGLKLN